MLRSFEFSALKICVAGGPNIVRSSKVRARHPRGVLFTTTRAGGLYVIVIPELFPSRRIE